ncbi:MAG: hypothetical protein NTX56_07740 [Proteobacteria bacterium]|nr:hypothetical protein [Pseudomonadota bacterium]
MHWTYESSAEPELEQGDILSRSHYITEILKKFHPYYANHPLNGFFVVLTQSCDLVRRNGEFKTPYLSIAPVRPLRSIIEREFSRYLRNLKSGAQPFATLEDRNRLQEFLARLFNNNNPRYFFLEMQPDKGLAEDMCTVLSLSISIKMEHYDECLKARILKLSSDFQAKLGWLVGQSFSRVATRDWSETEIVAKTNEVLDRAAIWVKDGDVRLLEKHVTDYEKDNPGKPVNDEVLKHMMANIPNRKEQAIDAVFAVLERAGTIEKASPKRFELRKKFRSDPVFAKFFGGGS